jgi:nuclear transport factor 2 (NTF2) superfamily protein
VKNAYTENSIWRNRDTFLTGHDAIVDFLTKKWAKENGYRLRKELFAFQDNKVGYLACLHFACLHFAHGWQDCGGDMRIISGLYLHPLEILGR